MDATETLGSHQQALYVINGLLTMLMIIGWYFFKGVIVNQKETDRTIAKLSEKLAVNSANDDNHQAQFKKFEEWMLRIEAKIDLLNR